jgi:D-alanyl-D-alanine dipeptidase
MRAILAIGAVQNYFHEEKTRDAVSLVKELRDVLVDLDELGLCDARIRSFFEKCIRCLETDSAVNTLDRVARVFKRQSDLFEAERASNDSPR